MKLPVIIPDPEKLRLDPGIPGCTTWRRSKRLICKKTIWKHSVLQMPLIFETIQQGKFQIPSCTWPSRKSPEPTTWSTATGACAPSGRTRRRKCPIPGHCLTQSSGSPLGPGTDGGDHAELLGPAGPRPGLPPAPTGREPDPEEIYAVYHTGAKTPAHGGPDLLEKHLQAWDRANPWNRPWHFRDLPNTAGLPAAETKSTAKIWTDCHSYDHFQSTSRSVTLCI